MKKLPLCLAPVLLYSLPLLPAAPAFAATDPTLPEMVISAAKGESAAAESTVNISTVTGEEMRERQIDDPVQAISILPGVLVSRQGGMGQTSTVSIRGASPAYTQFRLDDFPLRDPSDTQNSLNFFTGNLSMEQNSLSRIEVLKGSRGSLYGSSAMSGVVNMFTGSKWGTGFHGAVRGEAGSFGTRSIGGNISYGTDKYYFNFNPLHAATEGDRGFWYNQTGFNAGAGVKLTESTSLELTSLGIMSDGLMPEVQPGSDGLIIIPQKAGSNDEHRTSNMALAGLTLTHDFSPAWQTRLKSSITRTSRTYFGQYYPPHGNTLEGQEYYSEWLNTIHPLDNLTLLAGLDFQHAALKLRGYEDPKANLDQSSQAYAGFGKAELALLDRSLILTLGGRVNGHSDYNAHATWDVGLAYIFKDWGTRIYANVATGYRTPSLYERYGYAGATEWGPGYQTGNKNLKPESSITYEMGVEQKLFDDRLTLSAAVFHTDYDQMIDYETIDFITYEGMYTNKAKGRTDGFELSATARPWDILGLTLAYTYADTRSRTGSEAWTRIITRPLNVASATLTLYPLDSVTLAATARYEDRRTITLSGYKIKQPAYTTVDLAATWALNEHLSLFARVENLLDKKYTQAGYYMPGISSFVGMEVKF